MNQVFKSLIGTGFMYVILTALAVTLTMQQFLPVMAYIVAFTSMLNLSGIKFFKDIYKHSPDNVLSSICTVLFNLLAISGIIYISLSHTISKSKEPLVGVMYGVVLYALLFPVAKFGMNKIMEGTEGENQRESILNLIKGSLFIALLVGLHLGFEHIMNSLVKTRKNSNGGLLNEMIRNRYSLTNLPVKRNTN